MHQRLSCIALSALPVLAGCFGLSAEDEIRLNNYKYNAQLYYEKGDLPRSEQQCRRGLEVAPDDPSLNLNLAFAILRHGSNQQEVPRVEEARKLFLKIIDEGYYSAEVRAYKAYFGLATAELWLARSLPADKRDESQQYAGLADEHLAKVNELDPENIDAPLSHAQLRVFQGRLAEALPFFEVGLEQLKKSNQIKERELHNKDGKSGDAQLRVKAQLEKNAKKETEYRALKGDVLYSLGRLDEALQQLARVEELGGMTPNEFYNRGRVHESLGKTTDAIADYERFLKQSSQGVGDEKVRDALRRISTLKVTTGGNARLEPGTKP